ncbi:MAG TPA: tRNA (adenosine(37)-N6)-threonylcarbamoyltransferase complex ATPase subunit type 1 TsaE [Rhizomicrobium sp.]
MTQEPADAVLRGEVHLLDLGQTNAFAQRIAAGLRAGDVLALRGDLGAGKTALARLILRALGVDDTVPSPSFTLLQEYETPRLHLSHFDLYRIEDASELDELGFEDSLGQGVVLIEWPERAEARLPADRLDLTLEIMGDTARRVTWTGPGRWSYLRTHETT